VVVVFFFFFSVGGALGEGDAVRAK